MISQAAIKQLIITKGCYSQEENLRIYKKWFEKPRRIFLSAVNAFSLENKRLCDVGCAYGTNLLFCAKDSYGIEIEEYPTKFANSIGLTVYQRNIFDDISNLPQVDVVWSADTLEHVESPHIFLCKLHQLLKDNGLLILKIPTIPHYVLPIPKVRIHRYQTGYLHSDHINGFTCSTLRFFCERSGFKTITVGPFLSPKLRFLNRLVLSENIGQTVYVGSKIPDTNLSRDKL